MTSRSNIVQLPVRGKTAAARDLVIEGVERVRVNETRINHNAQQFRRGYDGRPRQAAAKVREKNRKLPEKGFRLLETTDASLSMILAAKSIATGVRRGDTVVLVSPEQPEQIIRKLEMTGMDVQAQLRKGQLIIFSSQPAISGNLSLSTNYRDVFGELFDLADTPVDRMIILGMDLLLNLESQYLAYASVSKFTQAADELGCKVIAQYSRNHTEAHDRLDAACSSLVSSYFVMKRSGTGRNYKLQAKNAASI